MTKLYLLGERGQLIGEGVADPDPLVPGRYLIPRQAVTVAPPGVAPAGKEYQWGRVLIGTDTGTGLDGEPVMIEHWANDWTLADLPAEAPIVAPSDAEIRRREILAELAFIDARSIRPLREGDAARVLALETQAQALRAELAGLGV